LRAFEIDPTEDSLIDSKLLLYETQSRFDEYAADRRVRHDPRMDASCPE
jgi:hypothetical protein